MTASTVSRTHGQSGEQRHASWMELFFDLAFVALAAQLTHGLHENHSLPQFAAFLGLFFPAWWTWVNVTVYTNLFDDDSVRARVLLLAIMLAMAAMSAAMPEGTSERAPVYAMGFAATRVVLFAQWWRVTSTGGPQQVPRWRPVLYCLSPALLWAVSVAISTPWAFLFWAAALAIEVGMTLAGTGAQLPSRFDAAHLVERVGLFVIIVLGESVITLVTAVSDAWSMRAGLVAGLGFVLLAALWWSYFDFGITAAELRIRSIAGLSNYRLVRDVVGLLHFLIVAGIIAMAGGLGTAIHEAGQSHLGGGALWSLAGGLALYHTGGALIGLRMGRPVRELAIWALPGIAVPLAVGILSRSLPPSVAVGVLALETLVHLIYARWTATRRRASQP
jgi:low temperature requirement protein LtrA